MDTATVQDVIGRWWVSYDAGWFDTWPDLLTSDAVFTCRTDTGATAYEEFVRADLTGRDEVLSWQRAHREASPYPLRHQASNVHATRSGPQEADFLSYLFVTQIQGGVSNLSSGICSGTVRIEDGAPRLAALHVVLDTEESVVFSERATALEPSSTA
jgi:hypothetical protein